MTAYQPLCSACRSNSNNVFFKTCPGCQARRAAAMVAWQKKPGMPPLPAPSVNAPKHLHWCSLTAGGLTCDCFRRDI